MAAGVKFVLDAPTHTFCNSRRRTWTKQEGQGSFLPQDQKRSFVLAPPLPLVGLCLSPGRGLRNFTDVEPRTWFVTARL